MPIRIPPVQSIPVNQVPQVEASIPIVRQIPRTVIETLPPPTTRPLGPPVTTQLSPPVVDVPQVDVPTYEPIDYTPENLVIVEEEPPRIGDSTDAPEDTPTDTRDLPAAPDVPNLPQNEQEAAPVIEVPFTDYELPVPRAEQVALAGTTTVASVGATLLGKALVDQLVKILKPVVKQVILRAKRLLSKDLTPYETQQILAFDQQKALLKRLKKEQKREKDRQAAQFARPRHQRILQHTETQDGKTPPA
jgi:hypothetical protein